MKTTLAALAALAAVMFPTCGCDAATAVQHRGSPASSSTAANSSAPFAGVTKAFHSPALGVSFRYPASWRQSQRVMRKGDQLSAGVWHVALVSVNVVPSKTADGPTAAFTAATPADLDALRTYGAAVPGATTKVLHSALVVIDGLRLAEIEYRDVRVQAGQATRHGLLLMSGGNGTGASLLTLSETAPASAWPRSRDTLKAILASMRFATPVGGSTPAASSSPGPLVAGASAQPLAGSHLWAAGLHLFSSGDGGKTWRAMRAPEDLYWNIAASDARHALVARPTGQLLATHDGGATWTVERPPDPYHGQLGGVACIGSDRLVVTGWSPQGAFVLTTADGGRRWRTSHLIKMPDDLNAVASPDARHLWAVGSTDLPSGSRGAIVASRDGGLTWTVQERDRDVIWRGVAFSDDRNGWAVGYVGGGSVIAHTTDGGATWTVSHLASAYRLLSVACSGPKHAWAVGTTADGSSSAIAGTQDGKTWSVKRLVLAGGYPRRLGLMSVTCSDASHLWAAGSAPHAGVVLASSDGGATWTVQSVQSDMVGLRSVTWTPEQ